MLVLATAGTDIKTMGKYWLYRKARTKMPIPSSARISIYVCKRNTARARSFVAPTPIICSPLPLQPRVYIYIHIYMLFSVTSRITREDGTELTILALFFFSYRNFVCRNENSLKSLCDSRFASLNDLISIIFRYYSSREV